jgi:uncharacterized protein YgiM (DUF1202 family)
MNTKRIRMVMAVWFSLVFLGGRVYAQSYAGVVREAANLRSGPGTDYQVVVVLAEGTKLFIDSIAGENGFYPVSVIETDTSGWIAKNLVSLTRAIADSDEKFFTPLGRIASKEAVVRVHNDSGVTMTLALDRQIYKFGAGEEKVLELPAGSYRVRASAPGILPYLGNENFEVGVEYAIRFYVASALGL